MSGSRTAEFQTSVTAGITITQGGGVSASIIVASLDGQTSLSLQASGSVTRTYNISVTVNIAPGKIVIAYGGTTKVTGKYTRYYCNTAGSITQVQAGTAKSWNIETSGGQQCDLSPISSLASLAKTRYC
ncbi:hypothetical protein AB0M47_16725 [Hamadaea sp. NPDC051192]|uniref:hypothetical protein n=1 Tax=Hamadaea sp. NPDC051192 TaxID=3154940 RepID=UPI003411FD6E